jgi:hypothetical protein
MRTDAFMLKVKAVVKAAIDGGMAVGRLDVDLANDKVSIFAGSMKSLEINGADSAASDLDKWIEKHARGAEKS